MTVFAVVFSNYYPCEVHSLWLKRRDALKEAERLGSPWRVIPWKVKDDTSYAEEEGEG